MIERNGKTYYPVIGLEIHAELATKSKMFCACPNDPDEERPNINICPVCTAQPGALPVPNEEAMKSVIRVGLSVGSDIANYTEFDRKNYFYPDIPKGYQISQYKYPIVSGGELSGVKITRIHLEEDTGISSHAGSGTLVNFNRAGVPLMELVTEPVIHDADTAMKFAKELQLLLRTLGVSEANLEKGEMRVEPNISVSDEKGKWGTKVEVKNLNSFSAVGRAIAFELDRMISLYEEGKESEIVQETRGWDETKQRTFSQRSKESAHDYRYFPDPDLPNFMLHELYDLQELKNQLPTLPWNKRKEYENIFNHYFENKDKGGYVGEYEKLIEFFIENKNISSFYDDLIAKIKGPIQDNTILQEAAKVISNDLVSVSKTTNIEFPGKITSDELLNIIAFKNDGMVNNQGFKTLLSEVYLTGENFQKIAEKLNLLQQNDTEALKISAKIVIDANPDKVIEYKAGKETLLMFFVGQVMKETKGAANPKLVQDTLKELLS